MERKPIDNLESFREYARKYSGDGSVWLFEDVWTTSSDRRACKCSKSYFVVWLKYIAIKGRKRMWKWPFDRSALQLAYLQNCMSATEKTNVTGYLAVSILSVNANQLGARRSWGKTYSACLQFRIWEFVNFNCHSIEWMWCRCHRTYRTCRLCTLWGDTETTVDHVNELHEASIWAAQPLVAVVLRWSTHFI